VVSREEFSNSLDSEAFPISLRYFVRPSAAYGKSYMTHMKG